MGRQFSSKRRAAEDFFQGGGSPVPSVEGEAERVALPEEPEELAVKMWEALNEDNKVSLFVRAIDLASGETEDVIINKYDAVCEE